MIKVFHNSRCSKSREGVKLVEESGQQFEIVEYMKNPMTADEIRDLTKKLNIKPMDLVRIKEAIWKENYRGKEMSDEEVIQAMAEHPRLIERPIVINGNKAVIGRPPVLIKDIL